MSLRRAGLFVCVSMTLVWSVLPRAAADTWIEIISPHFRVVSNAGDGAARNAAWQFEQIRSAIQSGWSWAQFELDRPFLVIAVKDERSMRTFAPRYWEPGVRVRPGSVSAPGLDRHTVLLRTDLRAERLPFWLGRGLSALLSNTNITSREVQFGRPIPWYVEELRQGRFSLPQIFEMTRDSPAFSREIESQRFDAQSWALVHYLVFGEADRAASATRLNEFVTLVLGGTPSLAAADRVYGGVAKLDAAYRLYLDRGLFRYAVVQTDTRVQSREFRARVMPEAEATAVRGHYLMATGRPIEARTAIDEAKAAAPDLAAAYAAEARLLDRAETTAQAAAAYERAAALGSDNFYVYVRLANLTPRAGATPEALAGIRAHLAKAIELNPRSAAAHLSLGGVLLQLNQVEDAIASMRRAATLEPMQSAYRVSLASTLLRAGQTEAARTEAQAALALARTEQQRASAQQLLARIGG